MDKWQEQIPLAVAVASDPSQSAQARYEAQAILRQVESYASGDFPGTENMPPSSFAEGLLSLCASLVATPVENKFALQSRNFGINLLHQLILHMWEDFPEGTKAQLTMFLLERCRAMCIEAAPLPFATKSKLTATLAEVTKMRATDPVEGGDQPSNFIDQFLLPELTSWPGARGVELACMTLRCLPDSTDINNAQSLPAQRKRALLRIMTEALPKMLLFNYEALNQYYTLLCQGKEGEAPTGVGASAQEHKNTLEAALSMALCFGEWSPVTLFQHFGIHHACGVLMKDKRFRHKACDVLRQQSCCKIKAAGDQKNLTAEERLAAERESAEQKNAVKHLFDVFQGPCQESLSAEYPALGSEEIEYGRLLCDTLVSWGKMHMRALEPAKFELLLQMMLAFLQHPNLNLATATIEFWAILLREAGGGDGRNRNTNNSSVGFYLPEGFPRVLCDVIVSRMPKSSIDTLDDYPSDMYDSAKEYCEVAANFRQRIGEILRQLVKIVPEEAFSACLRHLQAVFVQLQQNPTDKGVQSLLEAATHFLYTCTAASSQSVCSTSPSLETLTQSLLNFPITTIPLDGVQMQYIRCLESLGGHKHRVVPTVQRLLSILTAQPSDMSKWPTVQVTRQQAATTILSLAANPDGGDALKQHLQPLIEQIQQMWAQSLLQPGERNALYEAIVTIASFCGENEQHKVLDLLFSDACQSWSNPEWQQKAMSNASCFLHHIGISSCVQAANGTPFNPISAGKARLKLYHEVQLVERLSRRLVNLKNKRYNNMNVAAILTPHFKWTVPVMLRLQRCVHFLASPEGARLLGTNTQALQMGDVERAFLLGVTPMGVSPSAYVSATAKSQDMGAKSTVVMEGDTEAALRSFIRGARDSSYQYLGIVCKVKPNDGQGGLTFYEGMPQVSSELCAAIIENLQHQDDRCVRMLVRSFVAPFVQNCPQSMWAVWFPHVIPTLMQHMHSRLTSLWRALLCGPGLSASGAPPATGGDESAQAKLAVEHGDEILGEVSLRELTRDHLALMLVICTGDDVGHAYFQASKPQELPTLLRWLAVECVQVVACLMATAVAAITWPDSDAGSKAVKVCRVALNMFKGGSHPELQASVIPEMFAACLSSLTLPSHADFQSEILLILRDIIMRYGDQVLKILLSLPNIDEQVLQNFHGAMRSKGSEKDQRNLVRKLLLRSGGSELKALAQTHQPGSSIPQIQSVAPRRPKPANQPVLDSISPSDQSPLQSLF